MSAPVQVSAEVRARLAMDFYLHALHEFPLKASPEERASWTPEKLMRGAIESTDALLLALGYKWEPGAEKGAAHGKD